MGKVTFNISMSLDGFVAGTHDEVDRIFTWYFSGDTDVPFSGGPNFKVSLASAELFKEMWPTIGAMITGRRNFDLANAWNGEPPLGVPHFVLTHTPPQEWIKQGSSFTFVTDGVESAVAQAKAAAGTKNVSVSSPDVMRQCLKAGLLDEMHIDLVPLLLGEGVRLFEHLGIEPIELEQIRVVEGTGVTHLQFRVIHPSRAASL